MSEVAQRYYPSDVNDEQWAVIEPLLPVTGRGGAGGGRPARAPRVIVNGLLYVLKTGCPWRYVPSDYGPWSTIYSYFRRWREAGVWERLLGALREAYRQRQGRHRQASAGCLDSQSVKVAACCGSADVGYDGGKRIKGRKRHILVDTLGLLIGVVVTGAEVSDAHGGRQVMARWWASGQRRLCKLWADNAYGKEGLGQWLRALKATFKIDLEVSASQKGVGFQVIPRRWVVERTLAWLFNFRRLVKDYERDTVNSEAMVQIAMAHLLVKRLAK